MNTASRPSWTRARIVAAAARIFSPREQAASSSGTNGRDRNAQATSPPAATAVPDAAINEPVAPAATAKAKIPLATPREHAMSVRMRSVTYRRE